MRFEKVEYHHILSRLNKPSRYINHELNAYNKKTDVNKINFCLAFPDLYELGISNMGIKILYSLLNQQEDAVADRVYAPWTDFVDLLKEQNIPLFSLENKVQLRDFDVLGFTLQTEMNFTTVLLMLDLSRIPILSKDRKEEDPIVIAGGPCAINPLPLQDFIDVFFMGEAEEGIIEIKNCLLKNKNADRAVKLQMLSEIEGVYVPAYYQAGQIVKIRKYHGFSNATDTVSHQLIPWQQPTHDRFVAEIMRGCTRGCRFCAAGFFYRPTREKNPDIVVETVVNDVNRYGWEEAGLVSLSSSDYTCIKGVLDELCHNLKENKASLSLPSLRVDSIDEELLLLLKEMQQKGITIAPEAGSQRLRNIINKNLSEEAILDGIQLALDNNWKLVKLYFMIGLPFETSEDVQAIIDLVEKIVGFTRKRLQLNITLSPFIPKPFTPFQWAPMDNRESLLSKALSVKHSLSRYKFIKVKYHQIENSYLEGLLTRGDARVGQIIKLAYEKNAIFDGWHECFNFNNWEKAIEESGIDISEFFTATDPEAPMPWDFIDIGLSKEFFREEWKKAVQEVTSPDCREAGCINCGICNKENQPVYFKELTKKMHPEPKEDVKPQNTYYRIFLQKMGDLQFVTHLDFLRMVHRLLRAADIPIGYTEGFNPHPKVSFAPPLSIGVQGENEYIDITLTSPRKIVDLEKIFRSVFPPSLVLNKIILLADKTQMSMDLIQFEKYEIGIPDSLSGLITDKVLEFKKGNELLITRVRKGKEQIINLQESIPEICFENKVLKLTKKIHGASIFDILKSMLHLEREELGGFEIIRKELL